MPDGFFEPSDNVLMNASIGIHFVDKNGIIIYANPFELEILGYTQEEYVNHHVREFQLDEDILSDMLCRLTNNEPLSNYPARVQAKDKVKYLLYNSNVYTKGDDFIHTRCFASEIDRKTFEIFKRHSDYFK